MPSDFPIGAVIAYAGNNPSALGQGWLPCDGRSLPINDTYRPLFNAIGTVNGGNGSSEFNLPDYRGRFLRGVDHGAGRDPDASSRTASASGGATGDSVGSVQGDTTAPPKHGFLTNLPHLPTNDQNLAATAIGYQISSWNSDTWNDNITFNGGDKESRPPNLYLRYYIYTGIGD
jgi:phage-related tail fiber protein